MRAIISARNKKHSRGKTMSALDFQNSKDFATRPRPYTRNTDININDYKDHDEQTISIGVKSSGSNSLNPKKIKSERKFKDENEYVLGSLKISIIDSED